MTDRFGRMAAIGAALICIMGAGGMSQQSEPHLSAGCIAQNSKAPVSGEICALFLRELEAALQGRTVQPAAEGTAPDVTLVIEDMSASRLIARLDRGGAQGQPLATARKGAPLDEAAIAALLRGLIEAAPDL